MVALTKPVLAGARVEHAPHIPRDMRAGHVDAERRVYTREYNGAERSAAGIAQKWGGVARVAGSRGLAQRTTRARLEHMRSVSQSVDMGEQKSEQTQSAQAATRVARQCMRVHNQ